MNPNFSKWLQKEMDQRDWGQSDLARKSGVKRQVIWGYLNGKVSNPDESILQKIARAFRIPFEEIYRAAGILPPKPTTDEWIEKINHAIEQLPPEERERVYLFADALREQIEKKKKRK
jgi:transcriptional regulator with XRE-family HTH domain